MFADRFNQLYIREPQSNDSFNIIEHNPNAIKLKEMEISNTILKEEKKKQATVYKDMLKNDLPFAILESNFSNKLSVEFLETVKEYANNNKSINTFSTTIFENLLKRNNKIRDTVWKVSTTNLSEYTHPCYSFNINSFTVFKFKQSVVRCELEKRHPFF